MYPSKIDLGIGHATIRSGSAAPVPTFPNKLMWPSVKYIGGDATWAKTSGTVTCLGEQSIADSLAARNGDLT